MDKKWWTTLLYACMSVFKKAIIANNSFHKITYLYLNQGHINESIILNNMITNLMTLHCILLEFMNLWIPDPEPSSISVQSYVGYWGWCKKLIHW